MAQREWVVTRLFVAVTPPPDVLAPLDDVVGALRARAPGLSWVPVDRWHVTLAFLGDVDTAAQDDLRDRLERVARRHPPVLVGIGRGGRFAQRVLWVAVTGELAPLARAVARAAGKAGIEIEDRPWRGHLTLARARPGRYVDLRDLASSLATVASPQWTASTFALIESKLGPNPRHSEVQSWQLTGTG
jgi:2'-5' RNA ligase